VAYKLSERLNQNKRTPPSKDGFDFGKVAIVFIVYGIISLITAWAFSMETQRLFSDKIRTYASPSSPNQHAIAGEEEEGKGMATIGPITVQRHKEVYKISIASDIPENNWAFVEGEVLDAEKDYLFSFDKELWHETGSDSDGFWRELQDYYSIKVTFPQPGQYYLNIKTDGSFFTHDTVQVIISKKRGSSIPHMAFGFFALLIGIALNTMRKITSSRMIMIRRISND
jgi:hypothetical protein